jgi:hypothetical protein
VRALFHVRCFRTHLLLQAVPPAGGPALAQAGPFWEAVRALRSAFDSLRDGSSTAIAALAALRAAMVHLPGGGGPPGALEASSSALCAISDALQAVAAAGRPGVARSHTAIGRMLGLQVHTAVQCPACARVTRAAQHATWGHGVSAAALRAAAAASPAGAPLDALLAVALGAGAPQRCDPDAGGCGAAAPLAHALAALPQVFVLSIAWDAAADTPAEALPATLRCLDAALQPQRVFSASAKSRRSGPGADPHAPPYELRALVASSADGTRNAAFARTDDAEDGAPGSLDASWVCLGTANDADAAPLAGWEAVRAACASARLRPTLLFYERRAMSF